MHTDVDHVESSIKRLTAGVRRLVAEVPKAEDLGWWVLACGDDFNADDFAQRERARENLLGMVHQAGLLVPEWVWVWDESNRAQLVVATLPTRERAVRVAERLREKGLTLVIKKEMPGETKE